jgi:protein regulator of cytokinesis 1
MLAFGSPRGRLPTGSESCCTALLKELEQIWTEIGESDADKDRMLAELERECLQVYHRKVDDAANAKARLHQSIAAKEAELATLMASLGELNINSPIQSSKKSPSLKDQLSYITPLVEDLKVKKDERMKQFADIKGQIEKITSEISGYGNLNYSVSSLNFEEQDISVRKLTEYQSRLCSIQKEKSERFRKVLKLVNEVHSLCAVLDLDFSKTVEEIHPSLNSSTLDKSTNICDTTLDGLEEAILRLKTERKVRLQKLKDVAASLFELWNLMESNKDEKVNFPWINSIVNLAESDISDPGALSMEIIQQTSAEVERLTKLKASRMKELVMKRRKELEDICLKAHIQPDPSTASDKACAMIDSGLVDPCELLSNIEIQINEAKEECSSRREIMDRVEKWLSACDEEKWLEDYNQDDNRYAAGRGAHVNLKRAERARIMIIKISSMVDSLISKTLAWEHEKKKLFLYDGVRLASILEDYKIARQHKEDDKKRAREQKKLHDMLLAEKEMRFGSKPSPKRSNSFRNVNGNGSVTPKPRRNSLCPATPDRLQTPRSYSGRHDNNGYFNHVRRMSTTSLNFVAIPKEDTISFSSIGGSEPESPPLC